MIEEITQLTKSYYKWLVENTALDQLEDCVEITTPFLDRHNDHMQIYAERQGSGFLLSDDAYTINDLALGGCSLDTPRLRGLLTQILNGFRVTLENDELQLNASAETFALNMHFLLQAMIAVDDLAYLATPSDIGEQYDGAILHWLAVAEICFGAKTLKGTSGYEVDYKFVIPPSGNMPHRFVVGIAYPKRSTVEQAAFRWLDCRDHRPDDARLYPILNDLERDEALEAADALRNFNINPVLWSDRDSILPELAA